MPIAASTIIASPAMPIADGRLLALDCVASVDAGAYSVYPTSSALEAAQVASLLPGPYDFGLYRCRSAAVATNKCPILPYRGVARTGVCLAVEVIMDAIARKVGIEPYEARLRNLVASRADAVREHGQEAIRRRRLSGILASCGCGHRVARGPRATAQREPEDRLIGVGFSMFCEQGAMGTAVLAGWGRPVVPGYEQATVRLTADGDLEIRVGTHSHGQGHETTLAQVAHEILGIDFDRIKLLQGDTLYSPFSTGTWASRSMVMAGGAVAQASRTLAKRAARIGAWLMQADPADVRVENGSVVGRGASVTLREVARAWYLQPQNLPPDVDQGGLEVTAGYRPARDIGTFSYATHAALVAVDPGTGLIEILDYVVVEDGGKLVNPMIVDGQVQGGAAQGIGTCLLEAMPFDAQGQPLASTMLDYLLPGATEVPDIRVLHMETPSPHTEFGMKGIGEGGAVGPPAAIVLRSTTPCGRSAPKCTICRSRPNASWTRSPPLKQRAGRRRHEADEFRVRARRQAWARLRTFCGRRTAAAKAVAGGQSLGPMLNLRLVQPSMLVDITAIPELTRIEEDAAGVTIGACVTASDIEDGRVSMRGTAHSSDRGRAGSRIARCAIAAPSAAASVTPILRAIGCPRYASSMPNVSLPMAARRGACPSTNS